MPSIWPVYSGERCSAPRMMSWVRSLVWVIQHDTWRGWSACAAHERQHRARIVAGLLLHHRVIERAAVDARRRAGLQPVDHERAFAQLVRQRGRRRIAGAAGGVLGFADVDLAGEEGAGGQHHRGRVEAQAGLGDRTAHARRSSMTRSSTAAWNSVRFGCASTARRMKARYSARSAWQRVARTAGPFDGVEPCATGCRPRRRRAP